MGKLHSMTRQGTRYEPYLSSFRRHRTLGSPPPEGWGHRAGSHNAHLTGNIFDFLEDLNTRYGGPDLREIFRDHATQHGALGQSLETWIQYDEVSISVTPFLWTLSSLACLWLIRQFRSGNLASQSLPTFSKNGIMIKSIGATCQDPFRGKRVERLSPQLVNQMHAT